MVNSGVLAAINELGMRCVPCGAVRWTHCNTRVTTHAYLTSRGSRAIGFTCLFWSFNSTRLMAWCLVTRRSPMVIQQCNCSLLYLFHKYKPRNNFKNMGIAFLPTFCIRRKRKVNGVQLCEKPLRFDVRVVYLANTYENIQPSRGSYYKRSRKNSLKG